MVPFRTPHVRGLFEIADTGEGTEELMHIATINAVSIGSLLVVRRTLPTDSQCRHLRDEFVDSCIMLYKCHVRF